MVYPHSSVVPVHLPNPKLLPIDVRLSSVHDYDLHCVEISNALVHEVRPPEHGTRHFNGAAATFFGTITEIAFGLYLSVPT